MLIRRFEVQGFKNLVEPVVLDDLGEINVIHGDNNVGKSNLLEAMHLFFQLLGDDFYGKTAKPLRHSAVVTADEIRATGHTTAQVFNLYDAQPIRMTGVIAVSSDDIQRSSSPASLQAGDITIGLQLDRQDDRVRFTVTRFTLTNGRDGRGSNQEPHLVRLLTHHYLAQSEETRPTFALVEETRAIKGGETGGFLADPLKLRLYDAKTSLDPVRFERWQLFARLLQATAPNLTDGAFDVLYDRKTQRAILFFATRGIRLDAALLGSGIQQIATQLAQLLTSDALIIAVEEPECNLRYALQLKLRDLYRELVHHPFGPSQLFITSHSPAFETSDHFHAMWLDNGIPRLARRPVAEAPAFTGLDNMPVPPGGDGKRSYVTSDGLVEVPPFVLDALSLPQGGGVFFAVRKEDGIVEMLSHRQFLALGNYDDSHD